MSLVGSMTMLTGRLVARALALTLLCVVTQIALAAAANMLVTFFPHISFVRGDWPIVMIVLAHFVFVVALANIGVVTLRGEPASFVHSVKVGLAGGLVLLWPVLLLLMPLTLGPDHVSADGHYAWSIADLPWLVITWTTVTVLALPARIVVWARGERFVAHPPSKMLLLIAPWLAIVWLTGYPAQTCRGECWGLFEGGILMIPLFGAHLFLASFSCALLSAFAFGAPRPVAPFA